MRTLNGFVHTIDSKEFLNSLLSRADTFHDLDHQRNLLKFITDGEFLSRIEDEGEQYFSKADRFSKPFMLDRVKMLSRALKNPIEVFHAGDLREYCRFVVGLLDNGKESRLILGLGNLNQYDGHAKIVEEIKNNFITFSLSADFNSGGYLRFVTEGNRVTAIFSGSSGDFGHYSHLVLYKFKEDILKALHERFNDKDIELKIEVSGELPTWSYSFDKNKNEILTPK